MFDSILSVSVQPCQNLNAYEFSNFDNDKRSY
jgi:hypothetical protein